MKKITILASVFFVLTISAQTKRPDNWFNLDPTANNVNGVSTEKTYEQLLEGKKSTTIIVGVLDSGVDYKHEDLKDIMWTNPGEIAGNGIDDDKNGYIDDIHGWNFIGNKDGKNVEKDNLELTRVYKDLKAKYDGKTLESLTSKPDKKEFKFWQLVKADYDKDVAENDARINQYTFVRDAVSIVVEKIKKEKGVEKVSNEDLKAFEGKDAKEKQGKMIAMAQAAAGTSPEEFVKKLTKALESMDGSFYDVTIDTRSIVGDNYADMNERYYGNADCKGPASLHGTHVAGIIAATRKNNIGMDGVADNVRIMSVRCVPDGDERDKDIANAIRYAVDNGASILNMSFGKKYSPGKKAVDDAVKYAESKGVLILHAAGNDGEDIDEIVHYPCKKFEGTKKQASNFIDIGALSWKADDEIAAPFSNYGKKTVDLFSPGVDIYSTLPENKYADLSGTSMACPVAAGVAAVLKSYYPELTAKQLKKILIKSAITTYKKKKVIKPGTKDEMIEFSELSKTAGIINLYEAVIMAQKMVKVKG